MRLHHGHVLVGRRVKDDVRPLLGEDRQQFFAVGDGDQRFADVDRQRHPQLFGDVEQTALVVVDQDEPLRGEAGEQSRQFRADRAGGARDEYRLARDVLTRLLDLELAVRPAHQVVGRQLPQARAVVAAHQVFGRRDDEQRQAGLQADVEHLLVLRPRVAVEDEGDTIRLGRFEELLQVVDVADHACSEHRLVELAPVHSDDAHRLPLRARRLHELSHGRVRGRRGHDQKPAAGRWSSRDQAGQQAEDADAHQRCGRGQEGHGEPEHAVVTGQDPVGQGDEERRLDHGETGRDRIVDARHLPDPAVQLEARLGGAHREPDEHDGEEQRGARLGRGDDAAAVVQLLERLEHDPEDQDLDRKSRAVAHQRMAFAAEPGGGSHP